MRVGITAAGLVTPIGSDLGTVWDGMCAGRSGISAVTAFDTSAMSCKLAGVTDFRPDDHFSREICRRFSRSQTMLLRAVQRALEDRGLKGPLRAGVVVGVGGGFFPDVADEMADYPTRGWRSFDRTWPLRVLPNMWAGLLAKHFGLTGPSYAISTACASSADAVAHAVRMVASGEVDIAIAGGSEAWITPISLGSFSMIGALSRRPPEEADTASRPFDSGRDGFVASEGAGAVIVERLTAETPAICEIVGSASSNDAHDLIAPCPDGSGIEVCMRKAMEAAGVSPEQIGLYCMHATSTVAGDVAESRAVMRVMGADGRRAAVYAPKALVGHTSAASGVIETVMAGLILQRGHVPAQVNLTDPDPACEVSAFASQGRSLQGEYAIKSSLGFGGHNTSLLMKRV